MVESGRSARRTRPQPFQGLVSAVAEAAMTELAITWALVDARRTRVGVPSSLALSTTMTRAALAIEARHFFHQGSGLVGNGNNRPPATRSLGLATMSSTTRGKF